MIASNIIYVKDVLLISGEYNPNIYQQLISKTHYYSDISILRKCLKPFINQFCTIPFGIQGNEENTLEIYHLKSKKYYLSMKIQKELKPIALNFWLKDFPDFNFEQFYLRKIKNMKISKIKEFLFKMIHNICICNDVLYKMKLVSSQQCIYCDCKQNFKHLIYECRSVRDFWQYLEGILECTITYKTLIFGVENHNDDNNVFSVIMYIIYKKFVSDINSTQNYTPIITFVKSDLNDRISMYKTEKNLCVLTQNLLMVSNLISI